jgi:hypothetical protein
MKIRHFSVGLLFTACLTALPVMAAVIPVVGPTSGLTAIYSGSLDPTAAPGGTIDRPACGPGSPSYCTFFVGGETINGEAVVVTPNPTGTVSAVPAGILNAPLGSFLDLDLTAGNTSATLAGGSIAFPVGTTLVIRGETIVIPSSPAGFVLDATQQVTSVNADGQAEFLVEFGAGIAADFSTFTDIVGPGDCTGSLCALIPILGLDMNRYRLFVDWDPTFTNFTADFIGETANNSLVFTTLNSGGVLVPVPAAVWLFGSALGLLGWIRKRSLA